MLVKNVRGQILRPFPSSRFQLQFRPRLNPFDHDAELLQELITAHQNVWFMHDGAPEHFSIAVCNHLHTSYLGRWIGRSGAIAWPSRSPDLDPLDYFIWDHLKWLVCETLVATLEDLIARIVVASAVIASTPDLFERIRRCRLCFDLRGQNFKQFLLQSLIIAFLTSSCDTLFVL
ncbi:uncharacterized protein TNCV_1305861 [Trichonephila clavipes]|nr:uncharacterized protein TNCV_1305861 [Trichonephila clavipes]